MKNIAIGSFVLVLGFVGGLAFAGTPTKQTEVVTVSNESTWRKLKEVDDRGFKFCELGFGINAEMITALGEGDLISFERSVKNMKANTSVITSTGKERQELLTTLGY